MRVGEEEQRFQRTLGGKLIKKPHGLWSSADGDRIFVAHEDGHDMAVIDVRTGKVIKTVGVGRKPIAVVVNPR